MAMTPWPAGEPRMVLFGPGGYIVPRGDHAVLGSTMEEAGFEPRTTADGIEHIRVTTGRILPALLTWPIVRTWAGLRPMTTDGLPIIGPDPDCAGLVYACGHGRNGILLGPLTGEVVRDLVVRGETAHDIGTYRVERFGR
jgi:glycine oxidase